eukprot:4886965-Prymnesium_polylepis.3
MAGDRPPEYRRRPPSLIWQAIAPPSRPCARRGTRRARGRRRWPLVEGERSTCGILGLCLDLVHFRLLGRSCNSKQVLQLIGAGPACEVLLFVSFGAQNENAVSATA